MKIFFGLFLLITACNSSNFKFSSQPKNQQAEYYFKYNQWKIGADEKIDSSSMKYFSNILKEYNERSLYFDSLKIDVFRILVGRTFQKPYLLRIENNKGKVNLSWQQFSKKRQEVLETVTEEKSINLQKDYWVHINNSFAEFNFWNNPKKSRPLASRSEIGPTLIEGYLNGKHQVLLESFLNVESNKRLKQIVKELTEMTTINE